MPPYCLFRHCWAPINTRVADAVKVVERENRILMFTRTEGAAHKGASLLPRIVTPGMAGYTLVIIVGSGKLDDKVYKELKERTKERGIALELLPMISEREKWEQYKRAKLTLFLSFFEGFGLPPVESLCAGTPCIAFDLPVLREVCGDLLEYVPPGEIQTMAERIDAVLQQPRQSAFLRASMAQRVSFEKYAERIDFLFRESLNISRSKLLESVSRNYAEGVLRRNQFRDRAFPPDSIYNRVACRIEKTVYDFQHRILRIEGRTDLCGDYRLGIFAGKGGNLLGFAQTGIAGRLKKRGIAQDYNRFAFCRRFDGEPGTLPVAKLAVDDRVVATVSCERLTYLNPEILEIEYIHFEPQIGLLWIRGLFAHADWHAESVVIRKRGSVVARGSVRLRQTAGKEPYAGWAVESVVSAAITEDDRLCAEFRMRHGVLVEKEFTIRRAKARARVPGLPGAEFEYARTGRWLPAASGHERDAVDPLRTVRDTSTRIETVNADKLIRPVGDFDSSATVVLMIIHNFNAPERPEKRTAFEKIRAELKSKGYELVVLHHNKGAVGCNIPEVNFFDEKIGIATRINRAKGPGREAIPVGFEGKEDLAYLRLCARMLYGFLFSTRSTTKSLGDCLRQVIDEAQRVHYILESIQPSAVVVWHQWNSLMMVGKRVAEKLHIPVLYAHEGMLPGTLSLEKNGMMAESEYVGLVNEDVNPRTLEHARSIIRDIAESRLDRKPMFFQGQAHGLERRLREKYDRVLFYAGCNDWQSGVLPRDYPHSERHAGAFEDSADALQAVLAVAEANNWGVLYKPHPNLEPRRLELESSSLVCIYEHNAVDCIDMSDATITLLSSLAYIALAHGKPTVLMGRNTLSGTGATYDVTSRSVLDTILADALEMKAFGRKLNRFENHVACLLQNCLFPYGEKSRNPLLKYEDAAHFLIGGGSRTKYE